jgi:ketosteroid isomerase-like protein
MSQAEVGLVERAHRAFNERDITTLQAICSEDVVVRLIGGFAELMGAEFRGREAALEWIKEWMGTLEGHSDVRAIHQGGGRVVAIVDVRATGGASGAPAVMGTGFVYSFRDGQICAIDAYFVPEEALKAIGLDA